MSSHTAQDLSQVNGDDTDDDSNDADDDDDDDANDGHAKDDDDDPTATRMDNVAMQNFLVGRPPPLRKYIEHKNKN